MELISRKRKKKIRRRQRKPKVRKKIQEQKKKRERKRRKRRLENKRDPNTRGGRHLIHLGHPVWCTGGTLFIPRGLWRHPWHGSLRVLPHGRKGYVTCYQQGIQYCIGHSSFFLGLPILGGTVCLRVTGGHPCLPARAYHFCHFSPSGGYPSRDHLLGFRPDLHHHAVEPPDASL